jgi:lia operon protein LiaG
MPPRTLALLPAATLAILLPPALRAQQPERITLEGPEVAIYNLAGTLRVEGTSGDKVVVEVTRVGADAGRLTLQTGELRGRPALRVVYPEDRIVYPRTGYENSRSSFTVRDDGTFGDEGRRWGGDGRRIEVRSSGPGLDAHADLRVMVPRGRTVLVRHGVGETTIDGVDGRLSVSVAASRVRAMHLRGTTSIETGSGGLVESGSGGATIDDVRGGALHLDIGSGSLHGRSIEVRELVADVGSGGVRLAGVKTPRLHLETGSGGSDVELLGPVEDVSVEAGSGGVTLRLPGTTGAQVDVETGSGGVESDFAVRVSRVERRGLHGTLGDGRGRIRVEAGSGTVRLLKN